MTRHHDFNFALASQEEIDSAKRMTDIVNERCTWFPFSVLCTKWMAFRLQDGSSDKQMYDTRRDCVRHNPDYACYFTFRNTPGGINERDAFLFMQFNRHAFKRGARMSDPDDNREFITPLSLPQMARQSGSKLILPKGFI